MDKLRQCPKCGRKLPESEFAPRTRHCKKCRRDYDWQYKYGISPEQYFKMYKEQSGKCKICDCKLPDKKYLDIDHNKLTGDIRGLLCNNCNKGLGCFMDSPEILRRAAEYLEVNRCQEEQ